VLRNTRKEVEVATVRKLARKPYKNLPDQYKQLYSQFDKISRESLAKQQQQTLKSKENLAAMHTDASQSSVNSAQNGSHTAETTTSTSGVVVLD
jgi:hypothetical protein